jgi:SAM-dependent methyltransferase
MTEWLAAVEARHMADLRFPEVARAVRALSSMYVERRSRLGRGGALDGAGKRAAFALYYAPLHLLTVRHIVQELRPPPVRTIVDLGCGTGAAGCGWALAQLMAGHPPPRIRGIDRHPWAVAEARRTYAELELPGTTTQGQIVHARVPEPPFALVAAYTINELDDPSRAAVLARCLDSVRRGGHVLIVEPIARGVTQWWDDWKRSFERAGGRADEWRFQAELPDLVRRLDSAAGLDHDELTAKSLWLSGLPGGAV